MLGKALHTGLIQAGYTPDWFTDGETAAEALRTNSYAAVILDINLPGMSGLDLLKDLRRNCDLPVVIMTARDGLEDRITGLDLGADDCVYPQTWLDALQQVKNQAYFAKPFTY